MHVKKNLVFIFSLAAFITVVFVGLASAQIPQLINYQAVLTDPAAGTGLTGTYSVTFSIYDVATGGTALWTEMQSVTVNNGHLNVLLGSVTQIPLDLFDGSDRYLGVKVGTDPEMTPRQKLVSVGYAFKANDANQLSGKDTSDFVQAGQENSVSTGMIQDNAVTTAKIAPSVLSSIDGVINDGGNVDLVAGSNVTITPDDANNRITIAATGGGGGGDNLGNHTATQTLNMNGHWISGDGDNEGLFVQSDGMVNIGLQAQTPPNSSLYIKHNGSGTWQSGLRIVNPNLGSGKKLVLSIGKAVSTKNIGYLYFNYSGNSSSSNRFSMGFYDASDILNVAAGGKVGIGITNPQYKLDVNGTAAMTGFKMATGASAGKVLTSDASGNGSWQTVSGDNLGNHTATQNIKLNGHWLSGDGGNEGIFVANNGHVGIGTANPINPLTLRSAGPWIRFEDSDGGHLWLTGVYGGNYFSIEEVTGSQGHNRFVIREGGNIGINTTNPNYALDVNGTLRTNGFRMTPNAGAGKVLTSDAAGNGTWQTISGDNLGNHTATQNVKLNGHWLSGDGGNEGVFVKNDGKVGVGLSNPGYALHVWSTRPNDQIRFESNTTHGNPSIYVKAHIGHAQLMLDRANDWCESAVNLYDNGSKKWRIIMPDHTTGAGDRLDIQNSAGSSIATFLQSGNVGIGTKAPSEKLEVNGYLKADHFLNLIKYHYKILKWSVSRTTIISNVDLGLDNTRAKYILASVFYASTTSDHVNHLFGKAFPSGQSWYDYPYRSYFNETEPLSDGFVAVTLNGETASHDHYGKHQFLIIPLKSNHRMDVKLADGYTSGIHYIKLRMIGYIE